MRTWAFDKHLLKIFSYTCSYDLDRAGPDRCQQWSVTSRENYQRICRPLANSRPHQPRTNHVHHLLHVNINLGHVQHVVDE